MDELNLLRDGIPTSIALLMLLVTVVSIGAVIATFTGHGDETTLRYTSIALCLLGLGIATYVAITVSGGGVPQCVGGGGGCATVEKSKYSEMVGIHISYFGLIGYALILGASIWKGDRARVAGFVLTMVGFGFSMYLTYLELWTIKAICQWCVGSALMMTLLFIVATIRIVRYYGLDGFGPDHAGVEDANSAD